MTKRISYIDNTRAILIALVVLVHILNYANPKYDIVPYVLVQQFLDSFHMPAFFILSGMLTDGEKWRGRSVGSYFLHKAKTLLVPYLFFECIAILYKHFVLRSVSIAEGLRLMLTFRCNIGADWFLPAMFAACALYCLYIRFPKKLAWGIGGGLLFIALRFMPAGHVPTLIFRGALGFVFMLAGNLLNKPLTEFKTWKICVAFALTAAAAAMYLKLSINNSFFSGKLDNPVLYLVSGICGTYFVMGIARLIPWKWVGCIGQRSAGRCCWAQRWDFLDCCIWYSGRRPDMGVDVPLCGPQDAQGLLVGMAVLVARATGDDAHFRQNSVQKQVAGAGAGADVAGRASAAGGGADRDPAGPAGGAHGPTPRHGLGQTVQSAALLQHRSPGGTAAGGLQRQRADRRHYISPDAGGPVAGAGQRRRRVSGPVGRNGEEEA